MKRKRSGEERKILIQFWNCQLLKDHKIIKDDLWIRDGCILDPHVLFFDENIAADVKIDCKGLLIAPGYIDVQINGNTLGYINDTIDTKRWVNGPLAVWLRP